MTHYPDSEPTSLYSFSLMLRAYRRKFNAILQKFKYFECKQQLLTKLITLPEHLDTSHVLVGFLLFNL